MPMLASHRSAVVGSLAVLSTAWLATAGPPRYRIVDLTEIAAPLGVVQCEARRVDSAGRVIGFEVIDEAIDRGITWSPTLQPALLPAVAGDNSTRGLGFTADGRPLGFSEWAEVKVQNHPPWLVIITEIPQAVFWQNGQPVRLADQVTGGPPITLRAATDANAAGQIVGIGHVPGPFPNSLTFKGFLLHNGVVTDLFPMAWANAINGLGSIVGQGDNKAYLWSSGVITDLNAHPSLRPNSTDAFGINDAGLVVGTGQFNPGGAPEPTIWNNAVPQRLITEFIRPQGWCAGVNASGQIVGSYINLDNINDNWHGFLWQRGQRWDLVNLIAPGGGSGWEIVHPFGINDSGVIVGGGYRNGSWGRAFAMYPLCDADCNADGALTIADFGCFQAAFVAQQPYADCNQSGTFTIADFGCFQGSFAGGCR